MTKEAQNQIIKDAWVRNLQKNNDIPKDIGNLYTNWLRGVIMNAMQQQTAKQQQAASSQQQASQEQENASAPAAAQTA